jgi:drug/metabolite transporter (DMT)-like permease
VISEKLLRQGLTPSYLLFIAAAMSLPFYLFLTLHLGTLKEGYLLMVGQKSTYIWTLIMAVTTILANFMIVMSISTKNATMASLVEISYPVFTVIFAWLILRELQMNMYGAAGGLLIFAGIALIYLKG